MDESYAFILNKFNEKGEYAFLPEGTLENMVRKLVELDEAFMNDEGIEEGNEYDDDKAFEALFKGMEKSFGEHRMYLKRLCDDYLDYNEEYLESIDAIEWH